MALHPVNGLSLCAGIGGLDLGLSDAIGPAYRTVVYVEREGFCASILAARMADGRLHDAPVWSDLATFDGKPWCGVVDLVSAGYPCQPFSLAGSRKGADDPRHLWPHVARVVAECQPKYVFLENVPGHVSLGLPDVCADLRGMGYDVSAGIFSAAEAGAPHLRKRLFILAANAHGQSLECDAKSTRIATQKGPPRFTCDGRTESLADAASRAPRPREPGADCAKRNAEPSVGGRPDGLPSWVDGWEDDLPRVAGSLPDRIDRLRALGNAVVPATASLAWRTLSGAA